MSVSGLDPNKLLAWLLDKHRIQTVAIVHPEFSGLRITPNVFTTIDEADRFADAILMAIKKGLPSA